jgi:hypothetical protein
MVRRKTLTNFSNHRQDPFGTLVLYRSVTVYFDVQQNCLGLQKILYLVISSVQFIPTSPSSSPSNDSAGIEKKRFKNNNNSMAIVIQFITLSNKLC